MKTKQDYNNAIEEIDSLLEEGILTDAQASALSLSLDSLKSEYHARFFTVTAWGRPVPKGLDPDEQEAYLDDAMERGRMDWPARDDCPIRAAERLVGA